MSKQKLNKEEYIGLRLDKAFKEKCILYCENNCFSLSKRIRFLLEKDIEGKLIIK
jgi:hypothetical protein